MDIDTPDDSDSDTDFEDEPHHDDPAAPLSTVKKKKRVRITKKNPIYGFVEGARRGARKFSEFLHHFSY